MQTTDLEPGRERMPRDEQSRHRRAIEPPGADLASILGNGRVGRLLSASGVQRSGGSSMTLDESVARAIEHRRGAGMPLPARVRAEMEPAFGSDLSDVRLHTDSAAHELSESVQARAFTVGSDIFFKQGNYDTTSRGGRKLLAHELAHVVQQSGSSGGVPTRTSDADDPSEREAEALAASVTAHPPPKPHPEAPDSEAPAGRTAGDQEVRGAWMDEKERVESAVR